MHLFLFINIFKGLKIYQKKMSDEKRQIKNNCQSSNFLNFKGLNTLQNEIDHP